MTTYGRLAKVGFAWGILSRTTTELVAVPYAIILARLLSPSDFGVAAAASFFIQLAGRLTNFGFNTALVQLKTPRPEHYSSVFVVNVALGVLMWAGLTISSPILGTFFDSRDVAAVLPIAGLSFVIGGFGAVPSALLTRNMKFRLSVAADCTYALTLAISGLVMAWFGFGYWSLVYSQLLATAAQTVLRLFLARWRPSIMLSSAALREVMAFGIGVHMKRLLDSAALNLDNLVVGRTLGIASLGLYDKAFTSMNRAVIALSTIGPTVSFRIFAIIQEDHERFRLAYRRVLLTATLIGYPPLAWAIIAAPELFEVVFGRKWAAAVIPFQILCGAGLMKLLIAYASAAIQSKGRIWGEVWRQMVYVSLVVVGVAAGSHWGLNGAASGVLLATCVMAVLMHVFLARVASMPWLDLIAPQIPAVACSAVLVTVLLMAPALTAQVFGVGSSWPLLLVRTMMGVLVYVCFLLFCRFPEVRSLVDDTLNELAPWHKRWLRPAAR